MGYFRLSTHHKVELFAQKNIVVKFIPNNNTALFKVSILFANLNSFEFAIFIITPPVLFPPIGGAVTFLVSAAMINK